jgi:hypothetical protein
MYSRRLKILGALAGGLAAGGCGGSSPINPESSPAYVEAVHLDTLANEAAAAGYSDRYRLLAYPIAAMMEDVSPSTVSLSVDGAAETYQAIALEIVGTTAGSTPTPSDSIYAVAAWSDSDADELVLAEIALPDTLEDAEDLTDTVSNPNFDSATVLSISMPNPTNHCHTFTLPLYNAAVSDFLTGTQCAAGSATAAFTFYFTPSAVNPHSVFALASQTINAVRLVLPANNNGMARIRALRAGLRHMGIVVRRGPGG